MLESTEDLVQISDSALLDHECNNLVWYVLLFLLPLLLLFARLLFPEAGS